MQKRRMKMPLDFTDNILEEVPHNLSYDVYHEPTKFKGSKYVINGNTGEYIGIVGENFPKNSLKTFFHRVQSEILETLSTSHTDDAKVTWRSARNNAWAMMDINFPNWKIIIETERHQTEVTCRMCALTSVNASRSKTVIMGGKDTFCTNGLITENARIVKQKNTRGSSMSTFVRELASVEAEFMNTADVLQQWARTPIVHVDVKAMLDKIIGSEQMSKKMYSLYSEESAVRGANVFALYSAFTNYASYQDERNGFKLRNTGKDTIAKNMWDRESKDVMKWINTPTFKELVA